VIKYLVAGLVLLSINVTAVALPTAKLTLKVVDEASNPIEGAESGLIFYTATWGKPVNTRDKDITDSNGLFTGSGGSSQYIGYGATKDGYYRTWGGKFRMDSISGIPGFRRWQPWNPTVEVVLKKKINPIALYAHNMQLLTKKLPEIPVLNRFIGYDLIARDWVVPHGLGTHRDFLFKLENHRVVGDRDYHVTLTLQFPNEGDGIQSHFDQPDVGSRLRLPHNAPTTGYLKEVIINRERSPGKHSKPENIRNRDDQNYFFRVRTEKDEKGNIVSALYGKVHGGIDLLGFAVGFDTGRVKFNYYLNPAPNDTNLEFDTRKNLFTDLTRQEEVGNP